jgi:hypothetical protein
VLTAQPKGGILKTVKRKGCKAMAKIIVKKYFDRITFKVLTEAEYRAIIKKERLSDWEVTERFRPSYFSKSTNER